MSGIGDSVYPQLEAALVDAIPPAVKALGFSERVYCLRVYYDGTDTPGDHYVTRMRLVTAATRQEIIAKRGAKAPYYFWGADETDMPKHGIDIRIDNDPNVRALCQQVYSLLCEADDDESGLAPLRTAIQNVCRQLNNLDWTQFCNPTDDFVVFPADGAHVFMDDFGDLTASVPAARLTLLRSRRLLGSEENSGEI